MDLFTEPKKNNEGFSVDVAKELVRMHRDHFSTKESHIYPYCHILSYARYGKTFMNKPTNGIIPADAKRIKELGYDIEYNVETGIWTVSWE